MIIVNSVKKPALKLSLLALGCVASWAWLDVLLPWLNGLKNEIWGASLNPAEFYFVVVFSSTLCSLAQLVRCTEPGRTVLWLKIVIPICFIIIITFGLNAFDNYYPLGEGCFRLVYT